MPQRTRNHETAGIGSVKNEKGSDSHDARPDDAEEDLLSGPLPAG